MKPSFQVDTRHTTTHVAAAFDHMTREDVSSDILSLIDRTDRTDRTICSTMMSRQPCYWCCHAAVLTVACAAFLAVPNKLVDGFPLVPFPPAFVLSQTQQFSSSLHKNHHHHQPAAFILRLDRRFILRLDRRQTTTALSAETSGGGSSDATTIPVDLDEKLANVTVKSVKHAAASSTIQQQAPPVSFDKFLTMQDKRVVVTVQYSGDSGLRPYFLTVAKKLKASHPDVMIERRILAEGSGSEGGQSEATFEVLVDGKLAVGKGHSQKQKVARVDMSKTRSVFVSMQELDLAISRARRRRRPSSVVYGATTSNSNTPAMESSPSAAGGRR